MTGGLQLELFLDTYYAGHENGRMGRLMKKIRLTLLWLLMLALTIICAVIGIVAFPFVAVWVGFQDWRNRDKPSEFEGWMV